MRTAALKIALLVPLMVLPAGSRLAASGGRTEPQEKKKIVIAAPEKRVIVDGDRVVVWDDGDEEFVTPEVFADLPDLDEADLPHVVHLRGHRSVGYLGVRSIEMTPELRQHFGAPGDAGVLVGSVEAESPAARAGIQVGDILTAVDGEGIGSTHALSRSVQHHKDGETVKVDLLRDRSQKSLSVTIAERQDAEIRIGDLGRELRRFRWKDGDHDGFAMAPIPPVPPVPPVPPLAPDAPRWNGLRDRMDTLEQRLSKIESRLPPR